MIGIKRIGIHETRSDKITGVVIHAILTLIGFAMLYPILFVVAASFSDPRAINMGQVFIWPVGFHLEGYRSIFTNQWITIGYRNSLIYTLAGTLLHLVVTFPCGYALTKKYIPGYKVITLYMIVTMFFNGGLIPTFLVVRDMGLIDKPYTLIVLGCVNVFNCILCRIYIETSIPKELHEAAHVEGCSDIGVMVRICLPLSAPILAVLALFTGVGKWNDWFNALIYITTRELNPLQIFLREILVLGSQYDIDRDFTELQTAMERVRLAQVMRYALIIVASVPVLAFYPFVQKHFVKGVFIGSLKG